MVRERVKFPKLYNFYFVYTRCIFLGILLFLYATLLVWETAILNLKKERKKKWVMENEDFGGIA